MIEAKIDFDAAATDLHQGVNLVEASAGTGKTYAIAMLVLRFISEYAIKIDEILLVTFTRAATEELAERIRSRLIEARQVLRGDHSAGDHTLQRWAGAVVDRQQSLARIQAALTDIDRASIFTIHGFCQRILQEQALESGQLFDVDLQPDTAAVRQSISEDFWRKNLYLLPPRQCAAITAQYSSPAKLYNSIASASTHYSSIAPAAGSLQSTGEQFESSFQDMSQWWRKHSITLFSELQILVDEAKVKKKFSDSFDLWWRSLDEYFYCRTMVYPAHIEWLTEEGFLQEINGSKVRGKKKNELVDQLGLPGAVCQHMQNSMSKLILCLRVNLAAFLMTESEKRMAANNVMSYDDLIVRLHRAVTSPAGNVLRKALMKMFPAALIDEFQDTDLLQWQIFERLFNTGRCYLYLIGDPKQAIYRFRGADIHSYFLARGAASSQLTLKQNYRSHPSMIEAVNHLFTRRRNPFFYADGVLEFSSALPALGTGDVGLWHGDDDLAGMVYCQLPAHADKDNGSWGSGEASAAINRYIVNEVARLLSAEITVSDRDGQKRLQPSDIAILVRNNSHGEEYRQKLQQAGIPVIISSRDSVFSTDECTELMVLLRAVVQPGNTERLKKAMALSWFGHSGSQLYSIWSDDKQFDAFHLRFVEYSEKWQSRGLLVMMNILLKQEKVFDVLGSSPLMERKIANISHLLELLQREESDSMLGPLPLLQWLQKKSREGGDEDELRLEKDEKSVKIMTMHGAKGLEYPVVFCPYLWYRQTRMVGETDKISCFDNGAAVLDLGSDRFEERRQKAAIEEMAEELRLLYVAVTRAKLRCYVFWCDMRGRKGSAADSFESPLGYLLFQDGRVSMDEQQKRLIDTAARSTAEYHKIDTAAAASAYCHIHQDAGERLCKMEFTRDSIYTDWQITSYSGLTSLSDYRFSHKQEAVLDIEAYEPLAFASLPSGPNFGNVVHDALEKLPYKDFLNDSKSREVLERECLRYGVDADIGLLQRLMQKVVSSPLKKQSGDGSVSFCLADIEESRCLKEMAFYYHIVSGETAALNRILQHQESVVSLSEKHLEGYLTGFVDLIFEHDCRFYIVDYKTNNLGDSPACYERERLASAMASHNYGLQFWLYSLVLHNHLSSFQKGYDYSRNFGGVFYLFVRGMDQHGRGVYFQRPSLQKLELLGQCFGEDK